MVVVFFPVTHMASRNIERLWGRQVLFLHSPPSLYRSRWPGALEDKASRRCSRQNRQITRNLHRKLDEKTTFHGWYAQTKMGHSIWMWKSPSFSFAICEHCVKLFKAVLLGVKQGAQAEAGAFLNGGSFKQLVTSTCTRLNSKDVQNWVLACFSSAKETSVFLFRCFWILQLMSKVWCKSESLCMLRCLNLLGGILLWIPNLPASGAWKSWICEHHTTSPPYHLQHLSTMGQLDNNSHLICLHGSPTLLEGRSATWTCSRPTCLICL